MSPSHADIYYIICSCDEFGQPKKILALACSEFMGKVHMYHSASGAGLRPDSMHRRIYAFSHS